jgi:hypothetical protein
MGEQGAKMIPEQLGYDTSGSSSGIVECESIVTNLTYDGVPGDDVDEPIVVVKPPPPDPTTKK